MKLQLGTMLLLLSFAINAETVFTLEAKNEFKDHVTEARLTKLDSKIYILKANMFGMKINSKCELKSEARSTVRRDTPAMYSCNDLPSDVEQLDISVETGENQAFVGLYLGTPLDPIELSSDK